MRNAPVRLGERTIMTALSANLAEWTWARFQPDDERRRQYRTLVEHDPDLMFLQECRPDDLLRFAAEEGDDRGWTVVGEIPHRWRFCSAILARPHLGLRPLERTGPWFECLSGYVALGEVTIGGTAVIVASIHAPARIVDHPSVTTEDHAHLRRAGLTEAWHNDLAVGALRPLVADRSFMIGGDFNIARLFDRYYAPPSCSDFFERCRAWGWSESMRKHNPEEIRTFLREGTRPYQLDHLFTDGRLHERLQHCEVLPVPTQPVSDHAWLLAEFAA